MINNYLKIAWRHIVKNKVYAFINIAGLSVGMVVAILIGLWMWDELSFDKYHQNYPRIAQVMQNQTFNGTVATGPAIPRPLENEMRKNYSGDFKHIIMTSWTYNHILSYNDQKILQPGTFVQPGAPDMLTLQMLKGSRNGLKDQSSVLLSASTAKALFGNANPMDKIMLLDNKLPVKVAGVYEDLPYNTSFYQTKFMAPWDLYLTTEEWLKESHDDWFNNSFQMFVQINDNADMAQLSTKIKDVKFRKLKKDEQRFKSQMFLHAMPSWHLWGDFKNGVNSGGRIQYIYMFGAIGIFVLLLACINFMNLSTARSEKRAKEVGILKSIGSTRKQLIGQFYAESILIAVIAFVVCLVLVQTGLPYFNSIADKQIAILWTNPFFWLACITFTLFTGLIAGSYPALYLSSFNPVSVLKGTFRIGKLAVVPRQALVVLQFTVSVILIIGTIVVFKQIQYTKNRPVGYNRNGLVMIDMSTYDLHDHFEALRNDLLNSGVVTGVDESSSPVTGVNSNSSGLKWKGQDPNMSDDFGTIRVTQGYGKTVGWQFIDGRDFSKAMLTDSSGIVINEAAAKYMGFKHPVGETIKWYKDFKVIGVIKDMVMQSPYEPAKQTVFTLSNRIGGIINIRVNSEMNMADALRTIEGIHKRYTQEPFNYKFADNEYAAKFAAEDRIGKLALFFTVIAIIISCLGLFGMASYMAEKRTKEIGIRKVLGATVFTLWRLLSKDFVLLAIIALVIAVPVSYLFMHNWLQNYNYRTELGWMVFAFAAAGAIIITLLTVSYQSIKAAVANPVRSLKSE
jgi:putative ABC transport system permease protein